MMKIDIAMPTRNSAEALPEALDRLQRSLDNSPLEANRLLIEDDSDDDTPAVAREHTEIPVAVSERGLSLPAARERLMSRVETEWFLFLDDDVRVQTDYLRRAWAWTSCANVGAVQGRKASRTERASDWMRRRARRAGTHATLIRTAAVRNVEIPLSVSVLEDEYLRRQVEDRGWVWALDHDARFEHDCQQRHPIGWEEGYVAGEHDLATGHRLVLSAVAATARRRNPTGQWARVAGWLAGQLGRNDHELESSTSRQRVSGDA
jgi:glycosyltransferase involved in cell wall biosynthesis